MAKKSNLVFYRTKNGSIRCFDPTKKGKATNDAKNSDRKVVSAAKTGLKKKSWLKINASKEDEKNFKLDKDVKSVMDITTAERLRTKRNEENARYSNNAMRYNRASNERAVAEHNYDTVRDWNHKQNPVGIELYEAKNKPKEGNPLVPKKKVKTENIKFSGKTAATALKARKSKTKKK